MLALGRQRAAGEMNGKSGNLNNCCRQIYPEGCTIPANEVICIMDADQVTACYLLTPCLWSFPHSRLIYFALLSRLVWCHALARLHSVLHCCTSAWFALVPILFPLRCIEGGTCCLTVPQPCKFVECL